jgi:hypothetical protein
MGIEAPIDDGTVILESELANPGKRRTHRGRGVNES